MKKTFIEFLTEKFSRSELVGKAYKTDKEMIEHFLSGEVTIPITTVIDYVKEYEAQKLECVPVKKTYESKFQNGQMVGISFGDTKQLRARVTQVHFPFTKKDKPQLVKYDLELRVYEEETTRIYQIDEMYVEELKNLNPDIDDYLINGWKKDL